MPTQLTSHYNSANHPGLERLLIKLANRLLKECDVADHTLSILLVGDEEMTRLNNQYRQKNQPTNVLSFPFADGADASLAALPIKELGDIVISIDTAIRESLQYRQSLQQRTTWLLVHGLLHLLGYDHERSAVEESKMLAKEHALLNRIHTYRRTSMTKLAINVDHVATVRQARRITEPDPVAAAAICEIAGASGIVVHLREDRRHIQDRDVALLRQTIKTKLNLEMGANKDIIAIALDIKPDLITLVPEKREELTTEGGLDIVRQQAKIAKVVEKMTLAAIPVSIFVDPDPKQLAVAKKIGATFVELHTGRYCDATNETARDHEFDLLITAAEEAYQMGLRVCAGHGLDYHNTAAIASINAIEELSIGHAIIARSIFTGLDQAVRDMLAIIRQTDMLF